jgi:hypothetical protein
MLLAIRGGTGSEGRVVRFGSLVTAALVLALASPMIGVAAAPIVNDHSRFTDTFPDNICGIPGSSTINVVDNFKLYADGTFHDTATFKLVFTADRTGKQIQIMSAGQVSGPVDPIDNGDGTITFVATFKGLPEKLSIPNGPTLLRDAGNAKLGQRFRVNPDDSLTFIEVVIFSEKGPHPDLDSGFELFCDVLVPALS